MELSRPAGKLGSLGQPLGRGTCAFPAGAKRIDISVMEKVRRKCQWPLAIEILLGRRERGESFLSPHRFHAKREDFSLLKRSCRGGADRLSVRVICPKESLAFRPLEHFGEAV